MGPWTRRQRLPCAYPDKVLNTTESCLYGNFFASADEVDVLARESSKFLSG